MNAPAILRPVPASIPATDWTQHPYAAALLADCVANPPEKVRKLMPMNAWIDGEAEYVWGYSDSDDRVHELIQLSNAAFLEAETDGASAAELLAHVSVDEAIDTAINAVRA